MAMYAIDFIKAIQIVQAQRFSAVFGEESRNILQTYQNILQAKRNVFQSGTIDIIQASKNAGHDPACNLGESSAAWPVRANKRTLDELYIDELDPGPASIPEMGLAMGRSEGHAPFQDHEVR